MDPAILPDKPVKPNTVLMIMLGLMLGAVSGVGAAVGLDNMGRAFKDEESIEAKFNLPVLATIHTVVTDEDRASAKKMDIRVFGAASIYVILILLVLAQQFLLRYMGIKLI